MLTARAICALRVELPLSAESDCPAYLMSHSLTYDETNRIMRRFVGCKMATYLAAPAAERVFSSAPTHPVRSPIAVGCSKSLVGAGRMEIQRRGPFSSLTHVGSTQYMDSLCLFPKSRFVFVCPFLFPVTGMVLGHGCVFALRIFENGKASSRAHR